MLRVHFVNVEAVRFPVLVQTKAKIETRLLFQPTDVSAHFVGAQMFVVAIQVYAAGGGACAQRKAGLCSDWYLISVRAGHINPWNTHTQPTAG